MTIQNENDANKHTRKRTQPLPAILGANLPLRLPNLRSPLILLRQRHNRLRGQRRDLVARLLHLGRRDVSVLAELLRHLLSFLQMSVSQRVCPPFLPVLSARLIIVIVEVVLIQLRNRSLLQRLLRLLVVVLGVLPLFLPSSPLHYQHVGTGGRGCVDRRHHS